MLLRYRVENNPHLQTKKIISFSRRDFGAGTGLSYNSVQSGLGTLAKLGMIKIDPLKSGSKQLLRLTEPAEYNWELIQNKLGFRFIVSEEVIKKS